MTQPVSSPDTSSGPDNDLGVPLSPSNHPSDGPGVNYGVPPEYQGPAVPEQVANVNPSATETSPGFGASPTQPGPPAPPGTNGPNAAHVNAAYPDTSVRPHG